MNEFIRAEIQKLEQQGEEMKAMRQKIDTEQYTREEFDAYMALFEKREKDFYFLGVLTYRMNRTA